MSFGIDNAKKLASETIGKQIAAGGNLAQGMQEYFHQLAVHESELTPEAREYSNLVWDTMFRSWNESLSRFPDSVDKRRTARLLATATGEHPLSTHHFERLCSPKLQPGAEDALVIDFMQHTLDMLHDLTTGGTLSGVARISIATLLYLAVDEVAAGLHLARCTYSTQANAHVRAVFEILDKAELFHREPKWADVWASGDERDAWRELRPEKVRSELGRTKRDVLFSHLSNTGTHATFTSLQRRTNAERDESGKLTIGIAVGGVKREEEQLFSLAGCVVAAALMVLRTAVLLNASLNEKEAHAIIQDTKRRTDQFITSRIDPDAAQQVDSDIRVLAGYWFSLRDYQ